MNTAEAIVRTLESPNVCDSNGEAANVVDAVASLAKAAYKISRAILPDAAAGRDAAGGTVLSVTEAIMGMTGGLVQIAESINNLADAVRETRGDP